jgi:hypothetical protein
MSTSRTQTVADDLNDLINTVKGNRRAHAEPTSPAIPDASGDAAAVGESTTSEPTPSEHLTSIAPRQSSAAPRPTPRRRGGDVRKLVGKRSNIDYQMVGVYLRKSTARAVKGSLLGTEEDMSELIEKLLTTWLETRKSAASTGRARVDR